MATRHANVAKQAQTLKLSQACAKPLGFKYTSMDDERLAQTNVAISMVGKEYGNRPLWS